MTIKLSGGGGGNSAPKGWPITAFWPQASVVTASSLGGNNQVFIHGFFLPAALTFGHITVFPNATDAVNTYDVGIYTAAGALIANIGGTTLPTSAITTYALAQGSQTINPGLYLSAWTGSSTAGTLFDDANGPPNWVINSNAGTATGGILPSSITAPALSPSRGMLWFALT